MATAHPAEASARLIPSPMPRPAPVTRAARPSIRKLGKCGPFISGNVRKDTEGSQQGAPSLLLRAGRAIMRRANDPALTGIAQTFAPGTSRDDWKPIPGTPFRGGSMGGDD